MGRARKGSVGKQLLRELKDVFSEVCDPRRASWVEIPMADALLSAFAIFSMKFPSLLQFDQAARSVSPAAEPSYHSNLSSLYGINKIPSDTQMRVILDEVNPEDLRSAFKMLFSRVQTRQLLKELRISGQKIFAQHRWNRIL